MISACVFGTLLGYPSSPVVRAVLDALARRVLMGLAMGLTAVALICSPRGQRSGAHFNPATTLTFWRLGKVAPADAGFWTRMACAGGDRTVSAVDAPRLACEVHRWGRSRITRGITTTLLVTVMSLGLYLLLRGLAHVTMGAVTSPAALRPSAAAASFLANYFWLASICFGFIGTLRFSVDKEVTSCPACAQAGHPPFCRDPGTAFRRYITMMIVSTVAAFLAALVTFLL